MESNQGGSRDILGSGFKRPGLMKTCGLFSVVILLFLTIGFRAQYRDYYSGILITEFGTLLLPALLFLIFYRLDAIKVLRLHGTRPLNFLVTFGIMLFAIPLAGIFNLLNLLLVNSIFGKVIIQQVPAAQNGTELLINILVIAGSAGICEEFLFRGVIQRGLERFGAARSILLAAFLFSITHMDFQKIFGTFLLGALIGFIVYRTNSLYCGIFAHFSNNAVAVLMSYVSAKITSMVQTTNSNSTEMDFNSLFSAFDALAPQQLLIVFFIYGFMLLFILVIFILLLFALTRINPSWRTLQPALTTPIQAAETGTVPFIHTPADAPSGNAKGLLLLIPGILLIAGVYAIEIYRFTNTESVIIEMIKRLLGA